MPSDRRRADLGWWLCLHYRQAVARRGYQRVAAQLRKQGVPLSVTLAVLGIQSADKPDPTADVL